MFYLQEVSRDHILTLIERYKVHITLFLPLPVDFILACCALDLQCISWLSQSPKNVVHLQCSMFGYEHVLMGVAKKFNTKVCKA